MPVRPRQPEDLPACAAALRRVHDSSGYPSRWPDDPGGWITPRDMVAAWVAEHDGEAAGLVALVRGMRVDCLLRATGLPPESLGGVTRLYVDPRFQRRAWPAIALYERAAWQLVGTQPATWTDPDGSVPVIRCYVRP